MKDLIQEGRKIQELFKNNFLKEENFLSKIVKYIRGDEGIQIALYPSPSKHAGSFKYDVDYIRDLSVTSAAACLKILNKFSRLHANPIDKYQTMDFGGEVIAFFNIELNDQNKKVFNDSTVKFMVEECARKLSHTYKKYEVKYKMEVTAVLVKRGKIVRTIHEENTDDVY